MSKTVQLDPAEWKALALANVGQMHAFYSGIEAPTMQDLQTISAHLDRMKAFAQAWHLSQRPQQPVPQQTGHLAALNVDQLNQAVKSDIPGAKPIRKGGWPKGRKRNGASKHVEV